MHEYRLSQRAQFSIASLMLCLTTFCILAGLAVNYPPQAIRCAMIALPFAPAAILWLVLVRASQRPGTMGIVSLVGGGASLMICRLIHFATAKPVVLRLSDDMLMQLDLVETALICIGSALGPILFGGALLLDELRQRRSIKQSAVGIEN